MPSIAQRTWTELLGDHDWVDLLTAYKESPTPVTASRLLDALAPAAREICLSMRPGEASADAEDVWQQYQVAVLTAAVDLDTGGAAQWIPIRLLQRARRTVSRWLKEERRQSAAKLPESLASDSNVEEEALNLVDTEATHPLYRYVVLGEPYELQAQKLGVTADSLRHQVARDVRRLKQLRDAGDLESLVDELERLAKRRAQFGRS